MLEDTNKIKSPSTLSQWFSKLFRKQLALENNSKTLAVPKWLVYPIRQGIWMSVVRTQHGSVMKAITHCQERWAPSMHLQPWVCYLFWVAFGEKASREIRGEKKKRKETFGSRLTEGSNRQLAAFFGSRGCQSGRDDGERKWVGKEEAYLPLWRLSPV